MARPFGDPSGITTIERIAAAAIELFEARGFEHVTVDDIAVQARVTQRTVFRYYANKPALVLDVVGFSYFITLPAAPRLHDAVLVALDAAAERIEGKRALLIRYTRMIMRSVTLRAAARELAEKALSELREDLVRYVGEDASTARVHVLAEIVYAIAFGARHLWFENSDVRVCDVMHESFGAARQFLRTGPGIV